MRTRYLCALAAALLLATPALAQQQRLAPTDEARRYVQRHAFRFGDGLADDDLADLVVTDAYASRRSGTTYVYLRQAHAGVPVVGTEITVAVGADGRVFHAAGSATSLAGRALATAPALPAEAAAAAVAREAGLSGTFHTVSSTGGRAPEVVLSDGGVAEEPVTARLVYYRDERDAVALAWEVGLYERGGDHYWQGYVDAVSGRVLARHDLVVHDHFGPADPPAEADAVASLAPVEAPAPPAAPSALVGSYKVYPIPVESPNHTTPLPPADGRELVADPDDADASPFGWHDTDGAPGAEHTIARGNNVHAYLDRNADGLPDAGEPDGGPGLLFDFPIDLNQDPVNYGPAAVTNLFYMNNLAHDVLWHYGFDEAAGNFQVNNYGNGGVGGDDVRAEAQDGGGSNNANFFTPPDGQRPRMQMYLWNFTTPRRDGDFDNGLILHEYGHGYSNRLVGGPNNVSCLSNAEQMGEGISDFLALTFAMREHHTRSTKRGVFTYVLGQPIDGCGARCPPFHFGAAYAADFSINDYTYAATLGQFIPHAVGFVWATIWWEVAWDMIDTYGYHPDIYDADGTAGNQVMLQLLTEALKLTPCSPGFVDLRDAMFAADEALYNGAHTGTMWHAFARRGLGADASQGSSFSNNDNVEGFALPDVTLRLSPDAPPVVVHRGDRLTFEAELAVGAAGPSSVQYWVEATLPDGNVRVVLGPNTVHVTPGTTVARSLSQRVPGGAP
ncbi:MAG TPA: M36 family metallopeptidase, partial [Rubricoccaceae bacterium]|nr:M36 family metallopeptidase [Rubricoccaceae bacterium]